MVEQKYDEFTSTSVGERLAAPAMRTVSDCEISTFFREELFAKQMAPPLPKITVTVHLPINQNLADDRAEMQKICIDLVGAHYVRPRANAVRPYGHCVTVYVSAKSKFTVRSGKSPLKQKTSTTVGT